MEAHYSKHESYEWESTAENKGADEEDSGASISFIGPALMEVLDALPYYVLLVDEHHRIMLANKATSTALGVTPEELIGGYCPQLVHGVNEYPHCPVSEAVRRSTAVEFEVFNEDLGRWFKTSAYPTDCMSPYGGRIYFHTIVDIHDSKMAQEASHRNAVLSQSLVSDMPEGIAFLDRDFILRKSNTAFAEFIHKYSPRADENIIDISFFDLLPGCSPRLEAWFRQVRDSGATETWRDFEIVIEDNGSKRTVCCNLCVAPAYGDKGEIEGVILLSSDKTESVV